MKATENWVKLITVFDICFT